MNKRILACVSQAAEYSGLDKDYTFVRTIKDTLYFPENDSLFLSMLRITIAKQLFRNKNSFAAPPEYLNPVISFTFASPSPSRRIHNSEVENAKANPRNERFPLHVSWQHLVIFQVIVIPLAPQVGSTLRREFDVKVKGLSYSVGRRGIFLVCEH